MVMVQLAKQLAGTRFKVNAADPGFTATDLNGHRGHRTVEQAAEVIVWLATLGEDGPISSAEFVVGGQRFMGYNGGPYFSFTEGVSLYVDCADQDEVDEYWDKLVKAGAQPTQCGWIKDPFGLSWQIVPRRFTELIRDRDPRKVKAVMEAMMTMVKLDVTALEKAYNEA